MLMEITLSPYNCCCCRAGYIFLFLVFLLLTVHYQRTARAGLKHLHYSMFRVVSTTIRLQTRLRLWAILCMIVTTLLLWYLGMGTCTTNLQVSGSGADRLLCLLLARAKQCASAPLLFAWTLARPLYSTHDPGCCKL